MALFFCPPFFCHFKCTTDISVDVNMPFNVNAFQGDQNVVEYWIPDARTTGITEPERLTLRKSKTADRGLRVHAIVRPILAWLTLAAKHRSKVSPERMSFTSL
jgi:hypothetical protein